MPNTVVQMHRAAEPNDPRTDSQITEAYGAADTNGAIQAKYPDFARDYQALTAERKAALAPSLPQEFASGVSRGASGLLSTLEGAGGLAFKAVGADTPAQYLLQKAQANEQDAAANPPSVPSLSDANSASDYAHYFAGKLGELAPNLAEAATTSAIGGAVGAAAGTEVEPVGGTIAGGALGAVGGLFEKQAIKSLIRKKAIEGLADLETTAGQALLKNETSAIARSSIGQHVADTINFWAQSAGGTYNQLSQDPNVDPNTAIDVSLLGGLAQAVPAQFLPHYVVGKFFGKDPAVGGYFVRLASEAAKTVPGGMAAMSLQELGSIASEKYADPKTRDQAFDLSSWNKGDVSRLINASATGGLAGLIGAPVAAIPKGEVTVPAALKEYTDDLSDQKNQAKVDELAQLAQKDLQSGLGLQDQEMVDRFSPEKRNAYLAIKADVEKHLAAALGPQPSKDWLDRSDLGPVVQRIAENPSPLVAHPELDDADVLHQLWENEGGRPAPAEPEITPAAISAPANVPAQVQPNLAARNAAVAALNPEEEQQKVAKAAAATNPNPTPAQKEAGNYQKGTVKLDGLPPIKIENPAGSVRSGTGPEGPWSVTMQNHYGYFSGTEAKDGDQVDVHIGPHPENDQVFVVDQNNAQTGKFDEPKVFVGFNSKQDAVAAYDAGFSDGKGPQRRGAVTETTKAGLRPWLDNENTKKPFGEAEPTGPKPDWRVVVQGKQGDVPGYVQIIDPRQNERSQSPTVESLKAAGHEVPDFSQLPTGKYSWDEATRLSQQAEKSAPEAQPAVTVTPPVAKHSVGPDQIDFENTTLKPKETLAGEPSFFRVKPDEADDAKALGERLVSGARSKTQTDPYQATRRLTAVEDKETGKVYLLSTFKEKRGGEIKLADPEKVGDKKSPNTTLARLLAEKTSEGEDRYEPIASIRTADPRKAFVQEYPDRQAFEEHMGKPAEDRMQTLAGHAQSLEAQHEQLMQARGVAAPEPNEPEPNSFNESHAQVFGKLFGGQKELPLEPDFDKQFDEKIIGAGNAGYAALKYAMRAMLDHEPGITAEEALRKVKEQTYENLRNSFKAGAEPFEDATLRSFGQEPVEPLAGRGNGAEAANQPAGGIQTPAQLRAPPEQKSGGGNPVINNPTNLSFRQPIRGEDGKVDQRHSILLDTIHRAAIDAGLNVQRIGQDISGLAGEFAKRTGAAYDSASRTVAQVVSDVVGREDIVTSLHEVGHDVFARLSPDMQARALRAVDALGDRSLGVDISADPRIRQANPAGLPASGLSEERLAEATALSLTRQGFDPNQARGIAGQFVRALRDLFLKAAMSVQRALFGDEFTSPELAVKYFENRVKQFLAGDFNRNSFIEMLGGGNPSQAKRASWHDNGRALFERLGANGRPEYQHVPDLTVDASRLNNLVFRQPEQDADEQRIKAEMRSALFNHQKDMLDKSALDPKIIKAATDAKMQPRDFLIKRLGFTDPVEMKIELQKDLNADANPLQYDHTKSISGFQAPSNADKVARDAYINAQAMASKAGQVKQKALDVFNDLVSRRDKILAAHEEAKANYEDWNHVTSDATKAMAKEGRRLFASVAGTSKRMGVIEQQLRAIDPQADLKKYGPVFQKLFTGDELKGERLFTVLDKLANDPKIDFSKPMPEIRQALAAEPAYEQFVQNTPESKALTATMVAFAKTNARVMANLELRRMANGQERQAIASRLETLRQEKGDFLKNLPTLAKSAKLEDRVRQAYRQSLQEVRSMNERIEQARQRITAADAVRPILESEQAKLAGKLAIGIDTSFGDGTMYPVPASPKASTEDLLGNKDGWKIHTLQLDTSREKVSNPAEVESHLRDMAAFLNERDDQFKAGEDAARDSAYQSVKLAFDEIAANKNFRLNVTPSDRFMIELGVLGPGNKVSDAFGTPAARDIATRVNRETTMMDAMRPQAERIWRKNEQLERVLINMLPQKMANKTDVLRQDFLNPAKKTMQSQHALAEQYAGRPEGLKNAIYNRVMDMLNSNERTRGLMTEPAKWREGLVNLLEHQYESNQWFEKQARAQEAASAFGRKIDTGHGVQDAKIKAVNPVTGELESAVRRSVPVGPYTFSQKFSQVFRQMTNALRNSGWVSQDGEGLAKQEFGKIADTLRSGQDARSIVDKYFNHPIHGNIVKTDFLSALANMDTESPFETPKANDGVTTRPADIAKVLEAWKQSGGDPLKFAAALYDLHGGQDITDKQGNIVQDKASYVQSTMERMADIAEEAHKLMDRVEPDPNSAKAPIRGMMSEYALNPREIDHLPGQWFDYHSYDQRDTFNMTKRIAAQTAFGRGMEGLATSFDTLNHEVGQAVNKLATLRRSVLLENSQLKPKEVDKAVSAKVGPEEFKRLVKFSDREKFVRDAIQDISTYHRRDNSPDGTINLITRMAHAIGSLMVNQPSSALGLLTQLSDVNLRYGASKSVLGASIKSFGWAGKEVAASLLGAVGIQMKNGGELHDLYYGLGLQDPEMVRSARDAFGRLEGEGRFTHFLRAAQDVLGVTMNPAGDKSQHVPFQPFKLFDMFGSVADQGITQSVWQIASMQVARGMEFYRKNLDKFNDPNFKLSPEALKLKGGDKDSFQRLVGDMSRWDLNYDDMVRGALLRGDKTALSRSEALRLHSMAVSEIALRGSLSRSSAGWYNNVFARMSAPLIRWSFDRMVQIGGLRLNEEGQTDMKKLARGIAGLSIAAGGGIAVSALVDQYFQTLIGKQRNLRPVLNAPNANQAALGVMEELSRAGTFGMFGELANSLVGLGQGGDNRVLSVDQRVLAVSSLQSVFSAASAWANQGFTADYPHVVRPLIQSVGGGGLIQYMQLANHALGLDNEEARVTSRINAQNYLRVVGRQLGMDVRVSTGGGTDPTPVTPKLTAMELAAYKNDPAEFRQAYQDAVQVAKQEGHDDPVDYVKRAFATRNPLRSVFATAPTQSDYEKLLANMPGTGREDVSQAVRLFNQYSESIGAKPFEGKTEKSVQPTEQFKLPTLDAFRQRALEAIQ